MQLLIKNRLQQRLEWRRQCIEAHGEWARLVNQRAQLCVASLQMLDRFFAVKGEFGAASIMDHRQEFIAPPEPVDTQPEPK